VARETLADLVWPDSPPEQARASLRQALSVLRRALGEDVLESDATTVRLGAVETDLAAFLGGDGEALEVWRGELAEGLGAVSPEFDRWLEAERRVLARRLIERLGEAMERSEAAGDLAGAVALGSRMLAVDPLQEHVHRRIMGFLAAQGRPDAALKQYDDLAALLQRELGVEPDTPTRDLARDIRRRRRQAVVPEARSGRPAAPGKASVAVLPFQVLSAEADAAFVGDGLAEDLILELSRDTDLFVVARPSSFRFRDPGVDVAEIGAALGVEFLVGGSVRMAGERVRVTAHLSRCADGQEVWAERYDRTTADLFEVQTEIARIVTATVAGRIAGAAARPGRSPEDLKAYELVMRGTGEMHSYTEEAQARAHFRSAFERDPGYGRAHGLYALSTAYAEWYYALSTDLAEALDHAERAIRLDPRDSRARTALGLCHLIGRRHDHALFQFEAGLQANPNDDLLPIEYGRFLFYIDRGEDSLRRIREAMRLNPLHPPWYLNIQGRSLHTLGRFGEALTAFEAIPSPPFYVHLYVAGCHHQLGHLAEAQAARDRLFRARPDFDLDAYARLFPYRSAQTAERFIAGLRAMLSA
jgi:TolB-like protein